MKEIYSVITTHTAAYKLKERSLDQQLADLQADLSKCSIEADSADSAVESAREVQRKARLAESNAIEDLKKAEMLSQQLRKKLVSQQDSYNAAVKAKAAAVLELLQNVL